MIHRLAGHNEAIGKLSVESGERTKWHDGLTECVGMEDARRNVEPCLPSQPLPRLGIMRCILQRMRMILMAVLLSFSALVGVSTAAAANPVQEITFWTMQLSPFHDVYVKAVIADFEKQHPMIRVKWVDIPWAEAERKTLTAIAAKTAPDVVNLNPQFASKLAEFGALAAPESYLSPDEIAAYLPAAWQANQLDGSTFALPWYLSTNLIVYNKALFAEAGVTVPKTHAELLDVARAIKKNTGRFAYFPGMDGSIPLETMVAMGGAIPQKTRCVSGQIGPNAPSILDFYRTLYREELVPRNVVTEGHRKAVEMFLAGQVAMITTGMQFLQFIKNSNPDVYAKVAVAPQIGFDELAADGVPPNIAAMNVAVMQSSPHRASAFRFAAFVTNAKNQLALAERVPILPSTRASYEAPLFRNPTSDALFDRARTLSIAQAKRGAVLVPPMRDYNKFRVSYSRNLQSVMLGKTSVDAALVNLNTTWGALLGCPR
jgi:putative chitobiose transport system substrate-binding protein